MFKDIAHIHQDTGLVQTVREHDYTTGELCAAFLSDIGLTQTGRFLGRVHDIGKLKQEFKDYILGVSKAARGQVLHTGAAGRYLLSHFHDDPSSMTYFAAEVLAAAAGGHHGLRDLVDSDGTSLFDSWMGNTRLRYAEVEENLYAAGGFELEALFHEAVAELDAVLQKMIGLADKCSPDDPLQGDGELMFYVGMLVRVLTSAVMDADRKDTAMFMSNVTHPMPLSLDKLEEQWTDVLGRVESGLAAMSKDSAIDQVRQEISDACAVAANCCPGCFRLCVDTGGGKTLSGLRFAAAHAKRNKMRRLILASPLLSILDQNAGVIRDSVRDNKLILEHHSNVEKLYGRSYKEQVLLSEGWDASIIITTAVQFLDNLFSSDISNVRRMHAMCNSVIVLDEVQSIPDKMLTLFSLAVNFLCDICHSSVVLCSATQPPFRAIVHGIHVPIVDISPSRTKYASVFRRTNIKYVGTLSLDDIACQAVAELDTVSSVLIVCNKKQQARELFKLLKDTDAYVYHLSASMCQAHRKLVLEGSPDSIGLKESLTAGRRTICVSTQVIEAGVDISFGCAFRLMAGLDSIIQTAGRVNRNGELGPGRLGNVYVVNCKGEDLTRLSDIARGKTAMLQVLAEFEHSPMYFDNRLDSDKAIDFYYRALYRLESDRLHDYPVGETETVYDFLSMNEAYSLGFKGSQQLRQAFHTAGSKFHVFGSGTRDVIVSFGDGEKLITELCSEKAQHDVKYAGMLLKKARPYTVSVYESGLRGFSGLISLPGGAYGLMGSYDSNIGLSADNSVGLDIV